MSLREKFWLRIINSIPCASEELENRRELRRAVKSRLKKIEDDESVTSLYTALDELRSLDDAAEDAYLDAARSIKNNGRKHTTRGFGSQTQYRIENKSQVVSDLEKAIDEINRQNNSLLNSVNNLFIGLLFGSVFGLLLGAFGLGIIEFII